MEDKKIYGWCHCDNFLKRTNKKNHLANDRTCYGVWAKRLVAGGCFAYSCNSWGGPCWITQIRCCVNSERLEARGSGLGGGGVVAVGDDGGGGVSYARYETRYRDVRPRGIATSQLCLTSLLRFRHKHKLQLVANKYMCCAQVCLCN